MTSLNVNVRPRYTPGSPALVSQAVADKVADEERSGYNNAVVGLYGEAGKTRALALGLRGIVYTVFESGRFVTVNDQVLHDSTRLTRKVYDMAAARRLTRDEASRVLEKIFPDHATKWLRSTIDEAGRVNFVPACELSGEWVWDAVTRTVVRPESIGLKRSLPVSS